MLIITLKFRMLLVALIALPGTSFAQYFSYLHDYDSTNDWGYHIFLNNDKSFFIVGGGFKGGFGVTGMNISADGKTITNKSSRFRYPSSSTYTGSSGRAKKISENKYLIPVSVEKPHPVRDYLYQNGGFAILDSLGDTVLTRLYADTSTYREAMYDCIMTTDNAYILAGHRGGTKAKTPVFSGLLIKTDNQGKKLWEKTYQVAPDKSTVLNSVEELDNGYLLVGAEILTFVWVNRAKYDFYNRLSPWFLIVNPNNGNIIKDTIYSQGFAGGGNIFSDINGGFFHWGRLDTIVITPSRYYQNFFPYFAHLDGNFNIDRMKVWQPVMNDWRRHIWMASNTFDSGYILIGSAQSIMENGGPYVGWAAKLDKNGNVLWDNTYIMDSTYDGYLVDGVEMPDGGFVFTGNHCDGDSASWRGYDMWLLRVDSNGCLVPGCTPTTVQEYTTPKQNLISVYPNPTNGRLTIITEAKGTLRVYSMDGREIGRYPLSENKTEIYLPQNITPGIYFGRILSENNRIFNMRIIYQP